MFNYDDLHEIIHARRGKLGIVPHDPFMPIPPLPPMPPPEPPPPQPIIVVPPPSRPVVVEVAATEPMVSTAEGVAIGGGLLVLLAGALMKSGVLIGIGATFAIGGTAVAVTRHVAPSYPRRTLSVQPVYR